MFKDLHRDFCPCGHLYPDDCVCSHTEATLRRYAAGETLRRMTPAERAWLLEQAVGFGEGSYTNESLAEASDAHIAIAVLDAWRSYQDNWT